MKKCKISIKILIIKMYKNKMTFWQNFKTDNK